MINRVILLICIIGVSILFATGVSSEETTQTKSNNEVSDGHSEVTSGLTPTVQPNIDEAIPLDEAEIHYKQAMDLKWKQGKNDEAIEEINRAISLNSNRAKYYEERGGQLRSKKEYSKALNDFKKCATLSANDRKLNGTCEKSRTMTTCESGDYEAGIDFINTDFKSDKIVIKYFGDDFYDNEFVEKNGWYKGGKFYPFEGLEGVLYKGQPGLFNRKTGTFYTVGYIDENGIQKPQLVEDKSAFKNIEANEVHQIRVELSRNAINDEAIFYKLKADCYELSKQTDKAIAALSKAVNTPIGSDSLERFIFYQRAGLYKLNKQYSKAIIDLSRAIKLHGDGFGKEIEFQERAELYFENKQLRAAVADYQAACEMCRQRQCSYENNCESAFNVQREIDRGDKWVQVASSNDKWCYYDKTSVVRKSDRDVKVWIRIEPKYELDAHGVFPRKADFSHQIELWHNDCLNREIGTESHIEYDSSGTVLQSNNFSANATRSAVVPGSIGESIFKVICKKPDNSKVKKKKKRVAERYT